VIRLGTRGSALALTQARYVAELLEDEVELVEITTTGDRGASTMDKGRFVKEIEEALLDGRIDLAVHSAKDVPAELPDGCAIVGVPPRADPRDALCVAAGRAEAPAGAASAGEPTASLRPLPEGARVGTASIRRRSQLLALRPDLRVEELRGNVDTRLRRLTEGRYDAVVLAMAGLVRLDRADQAAPLGADQLVPAPGQGCLALEARAGDEALADAAAAITDRDALLCLTAERALVAALDATCNTPVGALAEIDGNGMRLTAYAGMPDGSHWIRDTLRGDAADPTALGLAVGERLAAAGVTELLAGAERAAGAAS
jgi:hydroxymethylbilane synthase